MSSLLVTWMTIDPDNIRYLASREWLTKTLHGKVLSIHRLLSQIDEPLWENFKEKEKFPKLARYVLNHFSLSDPESQRRSGILFEKFNQRVDLAKIDLYQFLLETLQAKSLDDMMQKAIEELFESFIKEGVLHGDHAVFRSYKIRYKKGCEIRSIIERAAFLEELYDEMIIHRNELQQKESIKQRRIESIKNQMGEIKSIGLTGRYHEMFQDLQLKMKTIVEMKDPDLNEFELAEMENIIGQILQTFGISNTVDISGITERKLKDHRSKDISLHEEVDKNKLLEIRKEVKKILKRILYLDPDTRFNTTQIKTQHETEQSIERLTLLRDHLKLEYGILKERTATNYAMKEELEEMIDTLKDDPEGEEFLHAIEKIKEERIPDRREVSVLRRQLYSFIVQRKPRETDIRDERHLIHKVLKVLNQNGYSVYSNTLKDYEVTSMVLDHQTLFFDTQRPEYKLQLTLNQFNEFVIRYIRIADSTNDISIIMETEKEKDFEAAKEWCVQYDHIKETLKVDGVCIKERIRKEPTEIGIQYMPQMDQSQSEEGASEPPEISYQNSEQNAPSNE